MIVILWIFWLCSWPVAGISFLAMPFREDEKHLFWRAMDLRIRDEPGGVEWDDSLEEGWIKLFTPGRFWHDLKGIGRRWVEENPKVAFKGTAFVMTVQFIYIVCSLIF